MHTSKAGKKQEWIRNLQNVTVGVACLEWKGVKVDEVTYYEYMRVNIERKCWKFVGSVFVTALVFDKWFLHLLF